MANQHCHLLPQSCRITLKDVSSNISIGPIELSSLHKFHRLFSQIGISHYGYKKILYSPQLRGRTVKTNFKLYCFKSVLLPIALYFFSSFFYSHYISLRLLGPRGGSRTAGTSKVEHFVIIFNGWTRLTIISKSSILDVAAALDQPLAADFKIFHQLRIIIYYFLN